jgi:5-methylcytosine-specific restriction endonuclease McrA
MGIPKEILNTKVSKYNTNVYVDKCMVCNLQPKKGDIPLETHHIKPQRDSDHNGFIGSTHKNTSSNLVTLCTKCHRMIEIPYYNKKLVINGWKSSSQGPILDYTFIKVKKN